MKTPDPRRRGCGCVSVVGGLLLVLLGIPMLVLPGPGIASILGGVVLIGRGLGIKRGGKRVTGRDAS